MEEPWQRWQMWEDEEAEAKAKVSGSQRVQLAAKSGMVRDDKGFQMGTSMYRRGLVGEAGGSTDDGSLCLGCLRRRLW